jgi:hypothetical protein
MFRSKWRSSRFPPQAPVAARAGRVRRVRAGFLRESAEPYDVNRGWSCEDCPFDVCRTLPQPMSPPVQSTSDTRASHSTSIWILRKNVGLPRARLIESCAARMTSELLSLMIAEGQRDTPSIAYEGQVAGLAVDALRNLIPRCTVQIS